MHRIAFSVGFRLRDPALDTLQPRRTNPTVHGDQVSSQGNAVNDMLMLLLGIKSAVFFVRGSDDEMRWGLKSKEERRVIELRLRNHSSVNHQSCLRLNDRPVGCLVVIGPENEIERDSLPFHVVRQQMDFQGIQMVKIGDYKEFIEQ